MKRTGLILVALVAVLTTAAGLGVLLNYEGVVVEYTASLDGNLDGCDCWGAPVSGLVKRAVRYRRTGVQRGGPDLLLDAGNVLPPGTEPLLSRHILESYRELGYDLVALGDQELSKGADVLATYLARYPLGSHNLLLPEAPAMEKPLLRQVGEVTLAVIALTGEESLSGYPREVREQFSLLDPVQTARALLKRAITPDHLIVVYHGSRQGARQIANSVSEVDAVIYGHEGELVDELLPNGTRLLSPGEHGNRVGRLVLRSRRTLFSRERVSLSGRNSFIEFDYLEDPDDPEIRGRIVSYHRAREARIAALYRDITPVAGEAEPLKLRYYYSPGCRECREFLAETAPRLLSSLPFPVELRRRNILNPAVYEEFESVASRSGDGSDEFPVALLDDRILQGSREIEEHLETLLRAAGEGKVASVGTALAPEDGTTASDGVNQEERRLSLLPVMVAGLLDGVNPCVFTALVFLVSSLLLLGKERRELLFLGGIFLGTVYLTYFLAGLGLFAGLRAAEVLPVISKVLRYLLALLLALLALLSVRDAAVARKGEAGRMILRLPGWVAERVHREIRGYRRRGALTGGTIGIAFLITILELGCTGQIYLPTLAYYARSSVRALSLLAVYNLAFILPLLGVFVAVVSGMSLARVRRLFMAGLPTVRLASALLFGSFAVAIIFLEIN